MKRALVSALVILLSFSCASVRPAPKSELTIQRVVPVPGYNKDKIYSEVKIWIAENFTSAKGDWKVHFTMRVDVKDDKFRQTFNNLMLSWPASYNTVVGYQKARKVPVTLQGDIDKIRPRLLALGEQMAAAITTSRAKDEW